VSNVTAILGGVVVFGDPLGSTPAVVALRVSAFLLVIVAAVLIPAPVRAAEAGAGESSPAPKPPQGARGRSPAAGAA
jgi:hypothetical protein